MGSVHKVHHSGKGRATGTGARPEVVVTGQWEPSDDSLKLPIHYIHALRSAGVRTVVASPFELRPGAEVPDELHPLQMATGLDVNDASVLAGAAGLLVPGGGDVDPAWYGQEPHPRTTGISHTRDEFERTMLSAALGEDLPVLCICHGVQILNVHLGGTLHQHLADVPGRIHHDRDRPRVDPVHAVTVKPGSITARVLGANETQVNSHHHQGIDRPAGVLEETAWAGDGVVEGVESRAHRWVVGVQWHPEVMAPVDGRQRRLFEGFTSAVRRHAGRRAAGRSR